MSSYDLSPVQRARFAVEATTFGDDLTDDVATNFFDLRHEPTRIMRNTVTAPDTTVVQAAFQRRNDVAGPDRASAQVSCMWTATNQALHATQAPTKRNQSKMLEALLGGYNAAQGSLVASAPATTGCVVTAGQGSRFTVGTIAALVISGTCYPVLITNVSTDTLTWWPALPSAPSVADVVYNSQSIYFTDQPSTQIQMLAETAKQRGNIWLGLGGQGDFTLDLTRGSFAKWGTTLTFAKYKHDDEFDTPQGGSSIARASFDDSGPIIAFQGGCHFGPTSSSTRSLVHVANIQFNFGRSWMEVGYHSGVEGLDEWQLNTREEITIDLTILKPDPYEDHHDAFSAETDYGIFMWLDGGGAGQGRCVVAPTCQIRKPPEPVDAFGMEGLKLTLLVKENSKSVDQTTEVRRSPVVLGHY